MPTWQYMGTSPYRFEDRFGNTRTLRSGDTIETYTQDVPDTFVEINEEPYAPLSFVNLTIAFSGATPLPGGGTTPEIKSTESFLTSNLIGVNVIRVLAEGITVNAIPNSQSNPYGYSLQSGQQIDIQNSDSIIKHLIFINTSTDSGSVIINGILD